MAELQEQHILVATFPGQGHINPALHLAKRLARFPSTNVTFSTTISGHLRMFPSSSSSTELHHNLLTFAPFSDGHDSEITRSNTSFSSYFSVFNRVAPLSLSSILRSFAARHRPVTCIIYTILLPWAADVARDLSIPSYLYWIQASTVFSTYQHYLHDSSLVAAHANEPHFPLSFPNLKPPLQIRDLPSLFTMPPDHPFYPIFENVIAVFDRLQLGNVKPKVLVNSFHALEPHVRVEEVELVTIGPLLPVLFDDDDDEEEGGNLFKVDEEKKYMEWLDTKEEGSVVYISFGSFSEWKKEQVEEMVRGLKESKRPFLWVVRKDNGGVVVEVGEGEDGMVVEWCDQVRVLAHSAVGCFVTHCGWNSTLESLVCGVPVVAVPQWTDQCTNAKLVESLWGCGVRGEVDGDGVLQGVELVRCLELVMGEGEKGVEIRNRAEIWRDKALEAVAEGGSSDVNLKAFVDEIKIKDRVD